MTFVQTESAPHILVVDDDNAVRLLMRIALKNSGYTADLAENGLEAIKKFKAKHYDLVFMDCLMPELDGYDATAQIRQVEQANNVQEPTVIVALTSLIDAGIRERCVAVGMNLFMPKPFSPSQLMNVLNVYLSNKNNKTDHVKNTDLTDKSQSVINQSDLDNIRALQRDGQASILDKVIKLYLADSKLLIRKLSNSIESLEFSEILINSHSLSSSSANLGARRLTELLRQVETLSRASSDVGINELLKSIEKEYLLVVQCLNNELDQRDLV